jgi:two-component system sensor histidine kinase AlgZ
MTVTLPPTPDWMPEFCRGPTVFAVMLFAELVVLIAVLAPHGTANGSVTAITTGSVLAQWIALSAVGALCALRPRLLTLPAVLALLAVLGVVALTAFAMSWLAITFDRGMGLSLIPDTVSVRSFVLGCMALALLVSLLGLRYGYMHAQWRLQIEAKARAEVDALTARIRPHFLFNSMNTVAGLIRVDAERAEQVIEDLSELFRAALAAGSETHSLERELELCERYLDIETLRVGDRLRVRWDVDDSLLDQPVLPLLLQPLVENAVYHGIQPLPEGGELRIRAARRGQRLLLEVSNPLPAKPTPSRGHGVALYNIARRLSLKYGNRAQLAIEPQPDHYAVRIEIPWTET